MKKILISILMLASAGGVNAAGFSDLAVKAADIKNLFPKIPAPVAEKLASDSGFEKWYGADSRQARMKFTTYMWYKVPASYTGAVSQILSNSTQRGRISELVDLQLQHMYGAFTMHPGFVDNPTTISWSFPASCSAAAAPRA